MIYSRLKTNITRAFRHNLAPGLALWALAIGVGVAYYHFPPAAGFFSSVAALKSYYGILYAVVATAVFGGLIPYCYLLVTGQVRQNPVHELLFYLIFWGVKGAEVDLFYRLQGHIFGTGNELHIVVTKTLFDQLFYGALWMVPTISLAYLWKESGFSFTRCKTFADRQFFTLTIPTIIVSNLLVWLPAVSVIYFMPPDLQVPLYNLVQCFFVLLLNILSKRNDER